MNKILWGMAALLFSATVFAQSGDSEIFIQQSGTGLELDINQIGQGNEIGDLTDAAFVLNGLQQVIRIDQIGSGNRLIGEIFSDTVEAILEFIGDNNEMELRVNPGGLNSADAGRFIFSVMGSNNEFDVRVADDGVADNATFDWDITGDFNSFDAVVNSDNYVNNLTVFGNYNNFDFLATGASGHSVDIDHTGNYANFVISQTATLETNTIKLETNTSGTASVPATICIYQSDSGNTGC